MMVVPLGFLDGFRFRFLANPATTFLEKTELNKSSSCLWKNRPAFDSGITKKPDHFRVWK
jgi:hypothetical protein